MKTLDYQQSIMNKWYIKNVKYKYKSEYLFHLPYRVQTHPIKLQFNYKVISVGNLNVLLI